MRKILLLMMAILLCLSCASMRMTPEEKERKERIEIYKLYLNYGIRDKSLTDEEVNKLDALKAKYGAFDWVIWQ
jgi:uncharacterized protein YcfL